MARLCIRIAPNNHPTDSSLNVLRTQPGDVVCVVNDGHVFSFGELNCGQYRFIDVPGVSEADLVPLVTPVRSVAQRVVRLRALTLDFVALNDVTWISRTTATKEQIASITKAT